MRGAREGRAPLPGSQDQYDKQHAALNPLTIARLMSPRLTHAYSPVVALAPIQIDQHEKEMADAPLRSRATATICGKYDARRSRLNKPKAKATRSMVPHSASRDPEEPSLLVRSAGALHNWTVGMMNMHAVHVRCLDLDDSHTLGASQSRELRRARSR